MSKIKLLLDVVQDMRSLADSLQTRSNELRKSVVARLPISTKNLHHYSAYYPLAVYPAPELISH